LFLRKKLSEEILKKIKESKIFITKDALNELQEYCNKNVQIYSKLDTIIQILSKYEFVTKETVKKVCEEILEKESKKEEKKESKIVQRRLDLVNLNLETGYLEFVRDRFLKLKQIIEKVNSVRCNVDTTLIFKALNKSVVRIAGMLTSKKDSKFGSKFLTFQDTNDYFQAVVPARNKELIKKVEEINVGDVFIVEGELIRRKDYSYYIKVSRLLETDAEWINYKGKREGFVICISDLRIGNKLFAENKFLNFIDFVNGKIKEFEEIASKINAIIITGDIIDGLTFDNIYEIDIYDFDPKKQYEYAANLLSKIDKKISIYVMPGERDLMVPFIPFIEFDKNFAEALFKIKNVKIIEDPSFLNIEGLSILATHGYYFESLYRELLGPYDKEGALLQTVRRIIKRREIIPSLNINGILPIGYDPFVIEEMPHVFAFGHYNIPIHDYYKNCLIISNSSWNETNEWGSTAYLIDISNREFRRIVF